MNKRSGYQGYISSRAVSGCVIPQRVQNVFIRDYCAARGLELEFSNPEYKMPGVYMVLMDILSRAQSIVGVIFYSVLQLPDNESLRNQFLFECAQNKCTLHFALESLLVETALDVGRVSEYWMLYRALGGAPSAQHIKLEYGVEIDQSCYR